MTPITSILPLVVVLVVAGIKELYEDIKRHLADRKFNSTNFLLKTKTNESFICSSQLKTGQVIKISKNQVIPVDCIPIYSTNEDGIVYLQTTAIDGETNLKRLLVPSHFINHSVEETIQMNGTLRCEKPNEKFDSFKGCFEFDSQKISINEKNLILQGTLLKNTEFIYAIVCYCSIHTKLSLNQTRPKLKKSIIDKKFNHFVFFMICTQIIICLILAVFSCFDYANCNDEKNGFWYIPKSDIPIPLFGIKKFFGYFTLLSNLIPISCQVSLEMVKFIQGIFFCFDKDMKIQQMDNEGNQEWVGMSAHSTALNDELGMVRYVLSDKTGTLTENQMVFKKASINGKVYQSNLFENDDENQTKESTINFLVCMAICNNVVIVDDEFQSISPDEEALCKGAKENGVELIFRNQKYVELNILGTIKKYVILALFEFNSIRKRMSILVRDEEGNIILFSKGADNVMLDKCNSNSIQPIHMNHLKEFSCIGLRTLVFSKRNIEENEFATWYERFDDASNMLTGRDDEIEKLESELETNLEFIGISGIEDKLQEGVPETIEMLLRGGIKIWVITGDKMETAINVGKSCGLLGKTIELINEKELRNCEERIQEIINKYNVSKLQYSIIIEGDNVDWCIKELKKLFKEVALKSSSVVCCRVTPLQKASIVECVKKMTKEVVLTIGDGANDVPMISMGNVGIGIYGKEGTQAVRASDFAIRRFSHLGKLLLYHGRECLYRNSLLIKLCFYKNAAKYLFLFYFAFVTNFTCSTIFDDYMVTFYNTFFTAIPPILSAVFDKDLTWNTISKIPEVNEEMLREKRVSLPSFISWFVYGIYQSIIFFAYFYCVMYQSDVSGFDGLNGGMEYTSVTLTLSIICSVLLTLALQTKTWNVILVIGHIISIFLTMMVYIPLCFYYGLSTMNISWYGIVDTFQQPHFYLSFIAILIMTNLPILIIRAFSNYLTPHLYVVAQELENQTKSKTKETSGTEKSPNVSPFLFPNCPFGDSSPTHSIEME